MKRTAAWVLALLLMLFAAAAMANQGAPACWAVVNNPNPSDRLNLRAEASESSISYGKYYNGTQVRILSGPNRGWYRVRVDELDGYMRSEYLAVGQEAAIVRDMRPEVTLTDGSGYVYLLGFRSGSVIGKVQSGQQVTVLGVGTKYLHVMTRSGQCGFVPGDSATPRLAFSASDAGDQGWTPQQPAAGQWATVNNPNPSDRLNLRAEASESSISYGKYYNGTQVRILSGPNRGWYRVRVGADNGVCDIEGYMKGKYLAFGDSWVQDARPQVTLYGEDGFVYLLSFHSGSVVGKAQNGEKATVLGVGSEYLHVITASGDCGLVPVQQVSPRLYYSDTGMTSLAQADLPEALIHQVLLGTMPPAYYPDSECFAEGHTVLGTQEKGGALEVYLAASVGGYGFMGGGFILQNGWGGPCTAVLERTGDGAWALRELLEVEDYSEIPTIMPDWAEERFFSQRDDNCQAQIEVQLRAYLDGIGRTEPIMTYAEVGGELSGMLTQASNFRSCVDGDYPLGCTTLERLEADGRYLYTRRWQPDEGGVQGYTYHSTQGDFIVNGTTGTETLTRTCKRDGKIMETITIRVWLDALEITVRDDGGQSTYRFAFDADRQEYAWPTVTRVGHCEAAARLEPKIARMQGVEADTLGGALPRPATFCA